MEFALEVKGLRKNIQRIWIKKYFDEIAQGLCARLIGENGAGKSTD